MFGNPETTPGGRALKFYSTIRLDIRRNEQLKVGDKVMGNKTTVKVVKNKVAPPFKTAVVDIMYGEGISREGEIVDLGSEAGIIDKSGAWYSYNGEKLGQGKENVKLLLKEKQELKDEIEEKVREFYGINLNKKDEYLKLYDLQLDNKVKNPLFKIMYLILNEEYEEALELSKKVTSQQKDIGYVMRLYYRIICLEHLENEKVCRTKLGESNV